MIKFKVKVMLAMRGMTQKELAERTGIRPPTVSAICVGSVKHLPVDALEKICDVLDCQPADLMEYVRVGVLYNKCFRGQSGWLPEAEKTGENSPDFVKETSAPFSLTPGVYSGKNKTSGSRRCNGVAHTPTK